MSERLQKRVSGLPKYSERHALQILLSGNWRGRRALYSTSSKTLATMVEKGWIEVRKSGEIEYRMTAAGREAFQAPQRI